MPRADFENALVEAINGDQSSATWITLGMFVSDAEFGIVHDDEDFTKHKSFWDVYTRVLAESFDAASFATTLDLQRELTAVAHTDSDDIMEQDRIAREAINGSVV